MKFLVGGAKGSKNQRSDHGGHGAEPHPCDPLGPHGVWAGEVLAVLVLPELGSSLLSAITGWGQSNEARMGGSGLGSTQTLCISTMERREGTSKPSAQSYQVIDSPGDDWPSPTPTLVCKLVAPSSPLPVGCYSPYVPTFKKAGCPMLVWGAPRALMRWQGSSLKISQPSPSAIRWELTPGRLVGPQQPGSQVNEGWGTTQSRVPQKQVGQVLQK